MPGILETTEWIALSRAARKPAPPAPPRAAPARGWPVSDLVNATPSRRCPICDCGSSCTWKRDLSLVMCHRRHGEPVPGHTFIRESDSHNNWGIYVRDDCLHRRGDSTHASPSDPCPVCRQGGPGCRRTDDGLVICQARFQGDRVKGWKCVGTSQKDRKGLWRREGDARRGAARRSPAGHGPDDGPPKLDFPSLARQRHLRALGGGHLARLAARLGVRAGELAAIAVGHDTSRFGYRLVLNADTESGIDWERYPIEGEGWCFPERDAAGAVVGLKFRLLQPGGKDLQRYEETSSPGLCYPDGWEARLGPVFIVEGGSDTAALLTMGLCVIGRPDSKGGLDILVELLARVPHGRPIVVLGENDGRLDEKEEWRHPGRDGAIHIAEGLARRLGRPVMWSMPPSGKDARDWLIAQGVDPEDREATRLCGRRFAEDVLGTAGTAVADEPPEEAPAVPAAAPAASPEDEGPEGDGPNDAAPPTRRDLAVGAALQLGMKPLGVLPGGTVLFARPASGRLVYVLPGREPGPGRASPWWPYLAGAARRRGFATRAEVENAELAAWAADCGDEEDVARLLAEGEGIGPGEDADLDEALAGLAGGRPDDGPAAADTAPAAPAGGRDDGGGIGGQAAGGHGGEA